MKTTAALRSLDQFFRDGDTAGVHGIEIDAGGNTESNLVIPRPVLQVKRIQTPGSFVHF
jgi:hypothetical protein